MQTRPAAVIAARRSAGLSQEALAEVIHVNERTIRNIETGLVRRPHARTLKALADALGVAVVDIATPDDEVAEAAS